MKIELDLTDKQLGLLKYAVIMLNIRNDEKLYFLKSELETCENEIRFYKLKERLLQSEECQKNIDIVVNQIHTYLKEIRSDVFI